jgi:hypothetical protein
VHCESAAIRVDNTIPVVIIVLLETFPILNLNIKGSSAALPNI